MIALSPLDATLVDELRVLAEISRNCPPPTPVESTLTNFAPVTPLSATLTKTGGMGEGHTSRLLLLNTKGLLHTKPALCCQRLFGTLKVS